MFIHNSKRFNIHASQTIDGVQYSDFTNPDVRAKLGITEIAEPTPPADYSEDTYYRTEQDDAPYVVYTKKSAEQIAAVRWEKIKQLRDELTDNGGCLVGAKWFHSDTKSKQQQMALVMLGANIPVGLQWKTMDGTFTTMTQVIASQLFAAQVGREQAIFAHAEVLRLDPNADITQGWLARFEP